MKKIRFLIASGPTREPLDPVRFISNYSTGAMGRNLAAEAKKAGHKVTWVECPKNIETALDLEKELKKQLPKNDVLIMAAAVCDVRPLKFSGKKIKKDHLSAIRVTKNPDILEGLSKMKREDQFFVGFALETENILRNAFEKMQRKGLDLLVLQQVTKSKNPFGDKPIEAFILGRGEDIKRFPFIKKQKLAQIIVATSEAMIRTQASRRSPYNLYGREF
ncbi:MAG: hypothetical protein AUJ72_03015 [Candidatus Omnitrophica bacterium CG1_02_46_14]|nr:MAG: hypothetical protein AUJ72_03015 [Candidatus Omnitrophica bacterium CG1_02_46_14]